MEHTAKQDSTQRGKITTVRVSCACGRYIQTDEFRKTSFKAMQIQLAQLCKDGPALEKKILKEKKQKLIIKDKEATFVDTPDGEDEPQVEEPE